MEERKYLYMRRYRPDYAIIIQYCWNRYYIARICENGSKAIAYTIREYKTLSGAERYMLRYEEKYGENKDIVPELFFGTEKFIKDGKFWKGDK